MNTRERMRVVLSTGISLATVIKWDKGREVSAASAKTLAREVKRLRLVRASSVIG